MAPAVNPIFLREGDAPSKQAFLKSALTRFVEVGIDGADVRSIARAAGYTNPALFKFFGSKEELALELFDRCYRHYFARLSAAIDPAADFRANLDATVSVFAASIAENPEAFLFVQDHLRKFWPKLPASTRAKSMLRLIAGVVEQGKAEQHVRRGDNTSLLVAAIVGFLVQFARMYHFEEFAANRRWEKDLHGIVVRLVTHDGRKAKS